MQSYRKVFDYRKYYYDYFLLFFHHIIRIIYTNKRNTMKNKTLVEMYNETKKLPTPSASFIEEICKATSRREMTVRAWVTGRIVPEINIQRVLAQHFDASVETLFPSKRKDHDCDRT